MKVPTTHSRREDPLFQGTTFYNSVNFSITTACSMKCPKCTLAMPAIARALRGARHQTLDEIADAAEKLRGLRRVHVTGGEPTLHPKFEGAVALLRHIARPEILTLESNGFRVLKHADVINLYFDRVFITQYVEGKVYPGSPDNRKVIEEARAILGPRLITEPPVEHAIAHGENTSTKPCSKLRESGLPSAYFNGKMYRCCVEPGMDVLLGTNLGVPLTKGWRDDLSQRLPHCEQCAFAGT